MVICSTLCFQPAPSREGRARREPKIVDRSDLIALGPKYLTPMAHKKMAGIARHDPTIVDDSRMAIAIRFNT